MKIKKKNSSWNEYLGSKAPRCNTCSAWFKQYYPMCSRNNNSISIYDYYQWYESWNISLHIGWTALKMVCLLYGTWMVQNNVSVGPNSRLECWQCLIVQFHEGNLPVHFYRIFLGLRWLMAFKTKYHQLLFQYLSSGTWKFNLVMLWSWLNKKRYCIGISHLRSEVIMTCLL